MSRRNRAAGVRSSDPCTQSPPRYILLLDDVSHLDDETLSVREILCFHNSAGIQACAKDLFPCSCWPFDEVEERLALLISY